ncbi:squalene monooxygenase [Fusarium proliferatum]|uniref:Squalene monooxygenase n=1 Tax=Gibberella intermedia TaxID=948311 RepID=A0A365N8K8_GIBIN|nr:squalene monooxygenase [Fusarium proliferatum]KAG4272379.1 squalene monooxygenase [Fusarium proliferatum]RBA17170.1 squalene monooxygenase [Fusarium proliferatum]
MASVLTSTESQTRRREQYHEADVVVVGAGVFGCTIAYALANQGRSVLLLERWLSEPDRIVGELLQPGGVASLQKIGLGHCLEGIDAMPCYGYTVFYHGEKVLVPYPGLDDSGNVTHAWGGHSTADKRPSGCSFHHGRFITKLRESCINHKNITVVETEVVKTLRGEVSDQILGVESRTKNKETGVKEKDYYFGQLTIIADGYDSKWRQEVLRTKPKVCSKFYALELIDCDLPEPGHGHVIIGNAFPILLYQIGTHETRALIDVPQGIPEASPENGGAINNALDQLYWKRKPLTGIINVLAQALYSLFAANDRQLRALQYGCFNYFKRGSTDGPVALLAGMLQRPFILAYHFFSVAFLAIWLNACTVIGCGILGIFKAPLAIIDAVLILWKACIVFLPIMYRETFQ